MEPQQQKVQWIGSEPLACQICNKPFPQDGHFIDGRTQFGPWALMCLRCHENFGVGLGTGHGQKYNVSDRMKVEG